jgi:hypothetical protein
MNRYTYFASIILTTLCLLGCQGKKKDPLLEEAYQQHQEAALIRKEITRQVKQIEVGADSAMLSTINPIKAALQEWDEAWVEVPGFEHEHHHDHDHDHDHHHPNTAPNLSAQEHLDLQKHLLEELKLLENTLKKLD